MASTSSLRGHVPAIAKLERAGDRAVVDDVAISLGPGVERGVEGLGHLPGIEHPHVARQQRVECPHEDLGRMPRRSEEMDDLPQGVDPGIGPAAGRRGRPGLGQALDRRLERLLNGPQPRLALPAVEIGAVVTEGQLDVPHGPESPPAQEGEGRRRASSSRRRRSISASFSES